MAKFFFKTAQEYVDCLQEADKNYYQLDSPKLSDKKYDDIKTEFQKRFPEHTYNSSVGSAVSSSLFNKVSHKIKMGSQEKINSEEDLHSWIKSINNKVSNYTLFLSEKLDGLSLSITYEKGELSLGATRGDGATGEDVTQNILKIPSIPLHIKEVNSVTIRGEVVILLKDFTKYFIDKANPRNAAAGSLRRLDGQRCEYLTFFAYDIIVDGKEFKTEKEKFEFIKKIGFKTPEYKFIESYEEIIKIWKEYAGITRKNLDYEIDGLIVSINELKVQEELGIINNRPRFSRAYKFAAQRDQTIIQSVLWFAGRTGKITPVAEVVPVNLAGVVISNVTIHNLAEIKRLGVGIGSVVEIVRAGDVIPKIEGVLDNSKRREIKVPDQCPACQEKTEITDIFLICPNVNCSAKHYETLLFWVKSLDIRGFGDKLVENLIGSGLVKDPSDYYRLTVDNLLTLERMGEKSASKVLKELHSKKEISLPKFIQGLGIPSFSEKRAELLMDRFPTLNDMKLATVEEILQIKGFKEKTAQVIVKGLENKKEIINNLLNFITIKELEKSEEKSLSGFTFCFTGVRDKKLEEQIKKLSGKISSGVSTSLTYLVCKDVSEDSVKLNKARELGVKILTLEQAWEVVNNATH